MELYGSPREYELIIQPILSSGHFWLCCLLAPSPETKYTHTHTLVATLSFLLGQRTRFGIRAWARWKGLVELVLLGFGEMRCSQQGRTYIFESGFILILEK